MSSCQYLQDVVVGAACHCLSLSRVDIVKNLILQNRSNSGPYVISSKSKKILIVLLSIATSASNTHCVTGGQVELLVGSIVCMHNSIIKDTQTTLDQ